MSVDTNPTADVERMEAGRALDALVAERVMEWAAMTVVAASDGERLGLDFDTEDWIPVPHYSTSIEAAWQVVDHLDPNHWDWRVGRQNGMWWAEICYPSHEVKQWAEALPLAICRAALKALA